MAFVTAVSGFLLAFGPMLATNAASQTQPSMRPQILKSLFFKGLGNLVLTLALATLISPTYLNTTETDPSSLKITDVVVIIDILVARHLVQTLRMAMANRIVVIAVGMALGAAAWAQGTSVFLSFWETEFNPSTYVNAFSGLTTMLHYLAFVSAVAMATGKAFKKKASLVEKATVYGYLVFGGLAKYLIRASLPLAVSGIPLWVAAEPVLYAAAALYFYVAAAHAN